MSNPEKGKKYKFEPDGITPDHPKALLIDAIENREKNPEAFLFTADEIKLIFKARDAILEVTAKYRDIPEENYTEEIEAQMLADYTAAFKRRRVPLKKLQKLTEKTKTQYYWNAALYEVKMFGKYGAKPFERYKVTTSTPEQFPERVIDPDLCPDFFAATTTAEKRKALGLSDLYLYISKTELNILQSLSLVYEQITRPAEPEHETAQGAAVNNATFTQVINSLEMNAVFSIGANARKEPNKKTRFDEYGQQISVFEFPTIAGSVQIENYNPLDGQGLISVSDPNTDKLLLQAQGITLTTEQKELIIPISDFMKIRGLNDNKTANEKARGACENLLKNKIFIDASAKGASIYGGFYYVQECYVVQKKGRGGNYIYLVWGDRVFNHLIEMKRAGRQIEQIDTNILSIPDNQGTAFKIARAFSSHLRKNAEKPNAHRLSVKNLLGYCPRLPLYPETPEQWGTENYIRKPFEAQTRIIKPFIDAFKYLTETGIFKSYQFTREGGRSISRAELNRLENDYDFFITLNIEVELGNEPNYAHLIESKNNRIEKAKKAKKGKKSNPET